MGQLTRQWTAARQLDLVLRENMLIVGEKTPQILGHPFCGIDKLLVSKSARLPLENRPRCPGLQPRLVPRSPFGGGAVMRPTATEGTDDPPAITPPQAKSPNRLAILRWFLAHWHPMLNSAEHDRGAIVLNPPFVHTSGVSPAPEFITLIMLSELLSPRDFRCT